MNPQFWNGRRVFVTGHTGFKGAWLCELLLDLGAEASGYALEPPTVPSLFAQLGLDRRMRHQVGDVRDCLAVLQSLEDVSPEIVFHLAAQPLVRQSYADPLETYATNVMGTAHVLEACRQVESVKSVIVVTTDKCYENREWLWGYRENEALGGRDPYSSSKAAAELVTRAYRDSFFQTGDRTVRVASVRAGNVIGGGDWADNRLIPDMVRAINEGRELEIRYPEAVRPWQHVLEPLRGYLDLAEAMMRDDGNCYADAWNFGPSDADAQPVRHVLDCFAACWPEAPGWFVTQEAQPHEAGLLKLDCSKAYAKLGWHPALDLDAALRLTADWYRFASQGEDIGGLTRGQIEQYRMIVERNKENHV